MKYFLTVLFYIFSINCFAQLEANFSYGHYYKTSTPQIGLYKVDGDQRYGIKFGYRKSDHTNSIEEQYNISFDFKKKSSGSFYFGFDLGYYYYLDQDNDEFISQLFDPDRDYHAFAVTFRIGNEWDIGTNFSLGCDWIGLGYGYFTSNRDEDYDRDGLGHTVFLNPHLTYKF